jgi:hypothetical protein
MMPVVLRQEAPGSDTHEFIGAVQLPQRPFRVVVSGLSSTGQPYQRFFHTLFHAETVEVLPENPGGDEIPAGNTSSIPFIIRNAGETTTFRIVAVDSKRFVSRVDPVQVMVPAGGSGRVTVHLAVPPDTPPATSLDLTITATSVSGRSSNGVVTHLTVGGQRQP